MGVIYLSILLLLFMVILTFTAVLRVIFILDTEKENVTLTLLWLYPFLKVTVASKASEPKVSVHFFNRKLFKKDFKQKKTRSKKNTDLLMAVNPTDIQLDVDYGFKDPFVTGITCGAINIASEYINFAFIQQQPDFIAEKDYIHMNATARVNVGITILQFIKLKINKNK